MMLQALQISPLHGSLQFAHCFLGVCDLYFCCNCGKCFLNQCMMFFFSVIVSASRSLPRVEVIPQGHWP